MTSFGPVSVHYDVLMREVPYPMWARYWCQLLERQGVAPTSVLDVCCGTGTLAELLTHQGYEVDGLDLSEGMIAAAMQKGLPGRFEVADATQFDFGRRYDACYSFFDSLNYIATREGVRAAIHRVAAHVRPGGSFIFDLNTAYAFENDMFSQSDRDPKSLIQYEWVGRYDRSDRIIRVEMHFWRDGVHFQEEHVQRAHSPEEILADLTDAGFREAKFYSSYTLRRMRPTSDRIHVAAIRA